MSSPRRRPASPCTYPAFPTPGNRSPAPCPPARPSRPAGEFSPSTPPGALGDGLCHVAIEEPGRQAQLTRTPCGPTSPSDRTALKPGLGRAVDRNPGMARPADRSDHHDFATLDRDHALQTGPRQMDRPFQVDRHARPISSSGVSARCPSTPMPALLINTSTGAQYRATVRTNACCASRRCHPPPATGTAPRPDHRSVTRR